MRRPLVLALVLLLAMPAVAGALRRGPGDGTLAIYDGRGVVVVQMRAGGAIQGSFLTGRIMVEGSVVDNPAGRCPGVCGAEQITGLDPARTRYSGVDVRFLLIADGLLRVRIEAIDMTVNVVGRGFAVLGGGKYTDPGRYSINGGPSQPLPSVPTKLPLGAPLPGTLGGK